MPPSLVGSPDPDHMGRGGVLPTGPPQTHSTSSWLETQNLKLHCTSTKSGSGLQSSSLGDSCAQKYCRGFSPRKGALGDDVFIGGCEDMKIFTQTQVRWNPASLCLAFRGNEELTFSLNIINVNTHIKKKVHRFLFCFLFFIFLFSFI